MTTDNFIFELPSGNPPTLTTTGGTPTSANGAAVGLFSGTSADTQDGNSQTFTDLKLTVSNVADTTEYLKIGGVDVALTNGATATLTGLGASGDATASVSVTGGTATVTISSLSRTNSQMNTLVDGITYGDTAATAGAHTVTLTRVTDSGHISTTLSAAATVTVTVPTAPAIGHLNGDSVAWVDASTAVTLDSGTNATASDADFGSGAWTNGSLTVQRSGTAWSADTFGFTGASGFSISGGNLWSGATTIIGTATNTDGMLSVTFNGNSTTALVTSLLQSITYLNATPAGNATIRFTLTDDTSLSATADVTVTTDNIYVTNTTDTTTANLTDGVSFSEAMAIANSQSGTQTLILAGGFANGTRTLAGNLAVSDNVIVDADLAGGMILSGGTITVASGTTLTFNNGASDTLTVASVLADGGPTSALAKTGAGTLTLTGTNTRTGTTSITGGVLSVAADSNLDGGTGAITLNGGTLAVTASGNTTIDNAVTIGAGGGTIDISTATVTFSGVFTSGNGIDLTKTGAGNLQLTWATNSTTMLGGITVSGGNLSLGGGATDAMLANGTITLNGGGLSTANLTGLTIDNAISLGAGNGTVTVNGNTNTITLSGIIGGTGSLTKAAGGTLALSGANTYSGGTTVSAGTLRGDATSLQGNITDNAAVEFSQSADGTYAGVISGTGALTKSGGAKLTLTGVNTYTGATTISASSTVSVSADANLGAGSGVTLNTGSVLDITGTTATITKAITLSGAATINAGTGAAATVSGIISGGSALTKTGAGSLTLSGANTYTGTTTISAGTLVAANNAALGTTAGGTTVSMGATLGFSGGVTVGEAVTLVGSGVNGNGALRNLSGDNTLSGAVTATTNNSSIGAATGTKLTLGGQINASVWGFNTSGAGTIVMSGTGSTTGGIIVTSGTLLVTGSMTSDVMVAGTLGGTGTITGAVTVLGGGTLAPGVAGTNNGAGKLTLVGDLTIGAATGSAATLAVDIAGATTAGTDYDQVDVTGTVTLKATAAISVTLGGSYTPSPGDTYTIINNDASDAISGTFSNGATTVAVGGASYTASYIAGGNPGNDFALTAPSNTPPTIANLNGDSVAWAGVGNSVTLDADTALTVADAELGNDWTGASLTVKRFTGGSADATAKDVFVINVAGTPLFTISGSNLQSGELTFATFSNSGGVLTVNFTSSGTTATTALVQDVMRRILYRNDTPYGDATIRFSLSDGTAAGTADVTVTSSTIYADSTDDTDSQGDAADGFSLREALARSVAQTGADTIKVVLSGDYAFTSGATIGAGDTLDLDGADSRTISGGTITLGGALTITNATSKTATISSVIAGTGMTLTKTGSGTLILSGTNTYTGLTTVSAGTLTVNGSAIADTAAVTVSSGATLNLGANETIGSLAGAGNVTLGGHTLTAGDSGSTSFSGVISGTGGLTKAGTGTLTLTGVNTYTGATTISAGTLALNNASGTALSDSSAVTVTGTLALSTNETIGSLSGAGNITLGANTLTANQTADLAYSGAMSGTGGLTKAGSGELELSGANTYTGATTVSVGTLSVSNANGIAATSATTIASGATLRLQQVNVSVGSLAGAGTVTLNGGSLTAGGDNTSTEFSGIIGVMSGGGLTKTGTGTLTLSGTGNTYDGGTTVSAGTLSIAGGGSIGTGSVTLAGGTTLVITGTTAVSQNIALTGNATISTSAAATISGVISGASFGITKSGGSSLILSGTNTYSGSTAVSAGTLLVTGALNATSGVTVSSGATLAGTGSIFAAASTNTLTVNSGGYLAPATVGTTGQLTVNGNLVLNGTLKLDLAGSTVGTQYDQVVVSGSVTLGASSAFDATYTASGSNNTFIVIDKTGAGAISGTIGGSVAEGGTLTSNSRQYKVSYVGSSGNDLTLQGNSPPTFTSTAATLVNEDAPYSYIVTTSDSDGDTVTVTATTLPSWLKFENGVLSGTPGSGDVGNHTVVLTATDAGGAVATQTFTITVGAVNQPPVFTSTPPTTDTVGTAYRYTPVAIDPEGKAVSFTATTLPPWLSFTNGVLSGTPGGGDAGNHTVVLTATDADGKTLTQTFTITVRTTTPPLNINQVTTSTTTTPTGNATTGTTIGSPTTITFPTSGSSISAVLGTSDTGGAYTATILAGNVNGNISSATGIQQIQGLTSTVTSSNASASADGSVLVRNAAGGNNNAISSFYGSGTIVSNGVMGGSAGNAGLNTGTTTSFGASGWGGGLGGGSAGALGGSGFGGIGANGVTGAWTGGTGKAAGNRAGNIPGSGNTPQNGDVRGNPQGDNAQGNARGGNIQENTQGRSPQDSGPPPTEGRPQNNVPKTGTGNEAEPQTWLPLQNLDFSGVDDFHDGFTTRLAGIANAFDTQSTRLDAALAFLERAA